MAAAPLAARAPLSQRYSFRCKDTMQPIVWIVVGVVCVWHAGADIAPIYCNRMAPAAAPPLRHQRLTSAGRPGQHRLVAMPV